MKNIRLIIRLIFLGIILILWYLGRTDIWGPLVFVGLLATPLFGRLYCGWICPVSTCIDLLNPVFPEPPLKKYLPQMLSRTTNIILFLLMLSYMVYFIQTNSGLPFFILMIPFGLVLTYLFGESCAHRNCLVGIIYSWLGRFSRYTYLSDKETCLSCLHCTSACPNGCLSVDSDANILTDKKHCLTCAKCKTICHTGSMQYRKDKTSASARKADKNLTI